MTLSLTEKRNYNKKYYEERSKKIMKKDLIFGYVNTLYRNEIINNTDINFLIEEFKTWCPYCYDKLCKNIHNVFIGVLKESGFKKIGCDLFNSKICCYMLTDNLYSPVFCKEFYSKHLKNTTNMRLIYSIASIYKYKGLSKFMMSKYEKAYKCVLIPYEIGVDACPYWKKYFLDNFGVNNYDEIEAKILNAEHIEDINNKYTDVLKQDLLNKWKNMYISE